MLIYHPAFDAYHCTFRLLALIEKFSSLEVDKARILDFYLAFPSSISKIRLPQSLMPIRSAAKKLANPYHDPVNEVRAFKDMQEIQISALRCLAAAELIDPQDLESGLVRRTKKPLPPELTISVNNFMENESEISQHAITQLSQVPLHGQDGLKDRTKLLEFRYDPI